MPEAQTEALELKVRRLEAHIAAINDIMPSLQDLSKGSAELQQYVTDEISQYALSIRSSNLDKDQLKDFFKHPYHLYKDRKDKENEWHLAIPKFIDVQIGYLERATESHNIFLVNRYVDWLGEIPQALKQKIGMKDPLNVFVDGDLLVGKDVNKVKEKYRRFIKGEDKQGNPIIKDGSRFELLNTMIKEDGILPFAPKPIPKDLLVDRQCNFSLRDYQTEPWEELKRYSNVGLFIPPSTGKTFVGLWAATHIKPPHLVAVPTTIIAEQWKERIGLHTDLDLKSEVDVLTYYSAIKQGKKKNYNMVIIDEVHHAPSDMFSQMFQIPHKVMLGLSATPQREDGREDLIFTLTGRPVGMSWDKLKHLGIIQSPTINVWIVKNDSERMATLAGLLSEDRKTIIFADSIEQGAAVSKRFGIPHVYGETKKKLETIQNAQTAVVSRVGDEGLSLPDIDRVIEISWLYGSRRQELQRFTRLLHGKGTEGEGHIIMTVDEYDHDRKRLFSVMDRGFKIALHREGITERVIHEGGYSAPRQRRIPRSTPRAPAVQVPKAPDYDESKYPMLKYAGIKKIVDSLNRAQKKIILFLLEPQNQNQSYPEKGLMLALGYTGAKRFRLEIYELIKAGYVKEEGKGDQKRYM